LLFIDKFKLPEEELAIFTSLFYGIVFIVAFGGVRMESRRNKMLISRGLYQEPPPSPSKKKIKIRRIKTILWVGFSVFSLGWLTPALVIYWAEPIHPEWIITAFGYLFSLVIGIAYVLKKAFEIKTLGHYVMFFVGVCFGAIVADRLFSLI
jgi:hypothetical protein